jgi:hypothetical protein
MQLVCQNFFWGFLRVPQNKNFGVGVPQAKKG